MDEQEGIPPPSLEVIEAAIRCGRRLEARIGRDLHHQGLRWGHVHALLIMERTGGLIHAGSLARRMGITRQSAHAILLRLDDRGFLSWRDESWIRNVMLTAEGRRALGECLRVLEDTLAAIGRVTVHERKRIVSAERAIDRELRRPVYRKPWFYERLSEERQGEMNRTRGSG
jgi:DNA-binding MarR family transcriptional regulator